MTGPDHGTRLVPVVKVAPPYRGVPKRHRRADAGPDGCDGRTDGHQTAGRRTGWTPDDWTPDGRTAESGMREPDVRTPDGLDTGRLDTWTPDDETDGWTPTGGRGRRRTAWQASWHPDNCDDAPTAGVPSGSSAGQTPPGAISNRDSSAEGTLPRAWPPPRPDSCRVTCRRSAGASAHCSPRNDSGRA